MLTLIGQSGFRGYRLVLALCALHLGASAFRVGVLLAVYSLMQAAAGGWVGRWSDRAGCYRPMPVYAHALGLSASVVGVLTFVYSFGLCVGQPITLILA